MKKKSIIMLLTLMLCVAFVLPGCTQDKVAKLAGDWHSETCIHKNKEAKTHDIWGEFSMTINEDHSCKVTFMGLDSKGTIEENEDGTFNLETKDFTDITLKEDGDKLTMDFSDDQIIFEKVDE